MTDGENGPLAGLISAKPLAGLLVLLTAVLLAGYYLGRSRQKNGGFLAWARSVISSLVKASAYVGLAALTASLLTAAIQSFRNEYGVYSQAGTTAWRAWQEASRQRGAILQPELEVRFFRSVSRIEQLPATVPDRPPLFRTIVIRQEESQNGIESFRGEVEITRGSSRPDSAHFNTFEASALFRYKVANRLDHPVEAEFRFPLAAAPTLIKSIQLIVNGNDLSGQFMVVDRALTWSRPLAAGQSLSVTVRYLAEGIDAYLYRLAEARELRDFSLTVFVDDPRYFVMTSPDAIPLNSDTVGLFNRNTWEIDQAIMAPTLGVIFVQDREYAPYDPLLNVLDRAPYAVTLALVVAALTLLLTRQEFHLIEILLLVGAIVAPYLLVMGSPALFPHFRIFLPAAVLASIVLLFLIFRRQSRLALILILAWMAVMVGGYPFLGLIASNQVKNAIDTALLAILIVYGFSLALTMELRQRREQEGTFT